MSSSLLSPSQASQVTLGGTVSQWPSRKCIFTAFFSGTGVRAVRRITDKRAGRGVQLCTCLLGTFHSEEEDLDILGPLSNNPKISFFGFYSKTTNKGQRQLDWCKTVLISERERMRICDFI